MGAKGKRPDMRALEKIGSDLTRLLQDKVFESEAERDDCLAVLKQSGKVPCVPPETAVQFAQDIMYEAWEEEDKKKKIKLAEEALAISRDCADAYNLLAEEEAETLEEVSEYYRKGMEAGRRALGEETFQEYYGHLWGFMPARPYMRARSGYMQCLWAAGAYEEAISQAREMLELNTNDNQGVRYKLSAYLAGLKRYDELDEFLNSSSYKEDCAAEWLYTRALVSFVKNGDSEVSNNNLRDALKSNKFVPEYLSGLKNIPAFLPDYITMQGEDEGFCYAKMYFHAWEKVPGAVDWLKKIAGIKIVPKAGRNEPCPCGSGRKYKKCCRE